MIKLLSAVGRATIVIVAAVIIVGGAVGGYLGSETRPELFFTSYGRWLGALVGLVLGVVSAGIVLGPLATLYDIRDNLRRMADPDEPGSAPSRKLRDLVGPLSRRQEPRLR
ncbi:MAG: hypothetical protein ACREU5_12315 [Burkholderiales bacterium]